MIVDFSVKNFRSFKDKVILSAEAGERLRKYNETNTEVIDGKRLLKSVFLFGPNGAGKSNLLRGLNLMKEMVLNDPPKVTTKLPYDSFAFGSDDQQNPTEFEINFTYEGNTYNYFFSYTENEIIDESLYIYHKEKKVPYFKRHKSEYSEIPDSLKTVSEQTKKNSLLLYNAQKVNDINSSNVIEWFNNNLIFFNDFTENLDDKVKQLINEPLIKQALIKFLKFADINIEDFATQETQLPKMPENLKKLVEELGIKPEEKMVTTDIMTEHKRYNDEGRVISRKFLNITNESAGTRKLFLIGLMLAYAKKFGDNKVLIFDEFETSLHCELSVALVKILNSKHNNSQVISTTHELKILDSGLRTDQIYFVEKDFRGISNIKSIFDFKDSKGHGRVDITYIKRYIAGMYGAYPHINVHEMNDALNDINKSDNVED